MTDNFFTSDTFDFRVRFLFVIRPNPGLDFDAWSAVIVVIVFFFVITVLMRFPMSDQVGCGMVRNADALTASQTLSRVKRDLLKVLPNLRLLSTIFLNLRFVVIIIWTCTLFTFNVLRAFTNKLKLWCVNFRIVDVVIQLQVPNHGCGATIDSFYNFITQHALGCWWRHFWEIRPNKGFFVGFWWLEHVSFNQKIASVIFWFCHILYRLRWILKIHCVLFF